MSAGRCVDSGNVRTIYRKKDPRAPSKEVRERAQETPTSGGGNQAWGGFNVSPSDLESKLGISRNAGGGGLKYSEGEVLAIQLPLYLIGRRLFPAPLGPVKPWRKT